MDSIPFILLFIFSVFLSSVSQVMLKTSANEEHEDLKSEYLNKRVIAAYALFFGSTLITVFAFRAIPLSWGPILESFGYVFVAIMSYFVLREHVGRKKVIGLILIVAGVLTATIL